jgi:ABC-2 type transport system permease protein
MTFWHDTFIIFRRQLRLAVRNPVWVFVGLLQPVLYLVLFGPLLEPIAAQLGTDNAYTLFVPGLLVQLGLFGSLFAGFGLIGEWRDGVIEAERVTPASRTALLLGRVLRDVLQLTVQGIVLVGLAFLFGLQGSVAGMIVGLVLVIFLGASCASASYALALTTKSEDALAPLLNTVALPILLLSGILLPMSIGPQWLQTISDFIPVKYVVNGVRELFVGDFWTVTTLWGVLWTFVLFAAGIWVGTRTFRRQNA